MLKFLAALAILFITGCTNAFGQGGCANALPATSTAATLAATEWTPAAQRVRPTTARAPLALPSAMKTRCSVARQGRCSARPSGPALALEAGGSSFYRCGRPRIAHAASVQEREMIVG